MSRSTDKHPDKVCPRGRARCGVCQLARPVTRRLRQEREDRHDAHLIARGRWSPDEDWITTAELQHLLALDEDADDWRFAYDEP